MNRLAMSAITGLILSACAAGSDAEPTNAMGSGMGGGMMMRGHDGGKTGGMSDMCAKMMAEHGTPSDEKKTAMMGRMKGCKMMPNAGEQKWESPQAAPSKSADPDGHTEHHPPQ